MSQVMKREILLYTVLLLLMTPPSLLASPFLIEYGMEGPLVERLQENLSFVGYEVLVDGVFGRETRAIVERFQHDHGLHPDGVVGEMTGQLLNLLPKLVEHLVVAGDTLGVLAARHGTTIDAIKSLNNLSTDIIYIDQVLRIPSNAPRTFQYLVEPGDTLGMIAHRYNVSLKSLRDHNQIQGDGIYIGEILKIPIPEGRGGFTHFNVLEISHRIREGETLSCLSDSYDVPVSTIRRLNGLEDDLLYVNDRLLIPDQPFFSYEPLTPGSLIWPVTGPISSYYGWRVHPIYNHRQFHGGIDIVVPTGTPVRAAASGIVIESRNDPGFGNLVVIHHGHLIETLYGHNSKLLVSVGDVVLQGRIIAYSGNTGISTGPHLCFRVFLKGETVDPLEWLP